MKVRPLRPGDDADIRAIFSSTLLLGAPVGFTVPDMWRYESLCLDWYLGRGRADAAVLEDHGRVVGYVLVCIDSLDHRRWTRRHAARFTVGVLAGFARGRYHGGAARFYALRLRDGWTLRRPIATGPHAHMNLLVTHRGGRAGRMLADHIDRRVRAAGLHGWFGEINAPAGQRAAALERLGGRVIHRSPNHTMSALVGRPVERLTVVRTLETGHDVDAVDAA